MKGKIQIAVIDSGWIMIGECQAGLKVVTLNNASVIRIWGTTKGLGQLALEGPTADTKLDKIGSVFVERAQIKFLVPVDESKWQNL